MREGDETAALLEEIASATGMPFPNLVYRVLGEEPARLLECWSRVREGLGALDREALRARILRPAMGAARPLEAAAPVSASRRRALQAVFDAYDAGNSCNAVVVRLLLEGSPGGRGPQLPRAAAPTGSAPARSTLPPMLELHEMSSEARDEVLGLAIALDPAGDVVPSAFRHLAHDPELLGALRRTIVRADRDGLLQAASREVHAAVGATAEAWPTPVAAVDDPATRAVLAPFARAIPRMLAVSALLRAAHCSPGGSGGRSGSGDQP